MLKGITAVLLSTVCNGIMIIFGAAAHMKIKEAIKFSLPYIAICFAGALMAVSYSLGFDNG